MEPAPGQPGSDQLPFLAAFGDPELIDCDCSGLLFVRRGEHSRWCLARRADVQRAKELANALQPEDILWLNHHGWDGRFG
jgi:hypothetical protein